MNCTGGTPTPAGQPVPAANIQIFLNTNVTSRLLSGVWSEALLMIDEPQAYSQLICGDVNAPATAAGVCQVKGTGTGISTYDGSPGHPNVFQGQMAGANSIVWTGIPFDAPGVGPIPNVRVIRITNVRSDASVLPLVSDFFRPPTPVTAYVSTDWIPLSTPQATVGFVLQGIQSSVQAPPVLQQCTSQNPALANDPGSNGTPQSQLNFTEAFATVFKTRDISTTPDLTQPPPLDQNNPQNSGNFNTESGFFSSLFPTMIPGHGNLTTAGFADSGTRLIARFENVPAGVKLFANAELGIPPNGMPLLRMMKSDGWGAGPYSPVIGNSFGLAPLPGGGSTRTVVYEVMQQSASAMEQANIPIYVAYTAKPPVSPGSGVVNVRMGLAPLSNSGVATETDPIPRFLPPATAVPAFTISSCAGACGVDVSAQTVVLRGQVKASSTPNIFFQYVSIQNTSANPIQGPVSLVLDNVAAKTLLENPTGFTNCAAPAQDPYLNVNIGSDNVFSPGEKVIVALVFAAGSPQTIGYRTRILAGPGNR